MLGRRALPSGRLAVLGATMELHHGLHAPMTWAAVVESSRVVAACRAAARATGLAAAFVPVARRLSFLDRDVEDAVTPTDRAVVEVIDDSRVFQALEAARARVAAAWWSSATAAATRRAGRAFASSAIEERIRLTSIALLTAVVVHVALTGFEAPEPTVAARTAWIVIGGILIITIAGARLIAAAWNDRFAPHPDPLPARGERERP